jgi:hypothetical protein
MTAGEQAAVSTPSAAPHPFRGLTRRTLMRRGIAGLTGLAGYGMLAPTASGARPAGTPRPIPGGFDEQFNMVASDPFVHVLPPGAGFEMSTIGDFNGVVGGSEVRGTARGSDGSAWEFDTDMRFMRGVYLSEEGRLRQGAFGFI